MDWHLKKPEETVAELRTDAEAGLDVAEASARLGVYGANELRGVKPDSLVKKFLAQFKEFIILALIAAAIIALLLGEWADSAAITAIVILNGIIGFMQEEKAGRMMDALKELTAPTARVIRSGVLSSIPARLLVPGDIILIESGDGIPADARIIESAVLKVQQSALTGESEAVEKHVAATGNLPLAERACMVYAGTACVYGAARAVVTSTGMETEIGRIAGMLGVTGDGATPLQRKLASFANRLVYISLIVCAFIFIIGIYRGEGVLAMFLLSVSLAVAAVPEGLPAVVTITLALGMQRLSRRGAIVRRLASVETLGEATVIATDKTGTITRNEMTVTHIYLASGEGISVEGGGFNPEGRFLRAGTPINPGSNPVLMYSLVIGMLGSRAALSADVGGPWKAVGDPLEGALVCAAMKAGIKIEDLKRTMTFFGELPFDSDRKLMTRVFSSVREHNAYVKGAPENVVALCTEILDGDGIRPITDDDRERISSATAFFSNDALKVVALAFRTSGEAFDLNRPDGVEADLTFASLVAMTDPPRDGVEEAVAKAASAGITAVMITGDHKMTALAVAKEAGIFKDGDLAVTGEELDGLSDEALFKDIARIKVYARVSPEHKLRVVRAWKKRGGVIAMTGDGINDAPALKEADIGVAMGISGTDVAKEASDMVLSDDNFATIVSAVEEGRGIFDNIRKVVHFLLSCNIGEVFVILAASLYGMPLPLTAVQILWTNLVTDGLPAIGLARERVNQDVMSKSPRDPKEGIVTGSLMKLMVFQGVLIAACTLGVYAYELYHLYSPLIKAQTMAFTVLIFCQKFHLFNCRSVTRSAFRRGVFSNMTINLAVLTIIVSQIFIIYNPALQGIFRVTPLDFADWEIVIVVSAMPLVVMEIIKRLTGR